MQIKWDTIKSVKSYTQIFLIWTCEEKQNNEIMKTQNVSQLQWKKNR